MRPRETQNGFAIVTVMVLLATLTSVLAAYALLTRVERETTRSSMNGTRAFYAAESGLNLRAEDIRQIFIGYNRPAGTSPVIPSGVIPCTGTGTAGAGDFACATLALEDHDVMSYVTESAGNPQAVVIPPGELYQNLNAQEYSYQVHAVAKSSLDTWAGAILELHFRSRLVPLFQFAAFYNKDLEILPGPAMTLAGPVHSNGDLYMGANATLTIDGQITTAGRLFHGRKNTDSCQSGGVSVFNPVSATAIPGCGPGRLALSDADTLPFNGMIHMDVDELTVPPAESLDPIGGNPHWDLADLRIMLDADTGTIQVRDSSHTDLGLGLCGSSVHTSDFLNRRENSTIEMLEVDVQALLDCVYANPTLMGGRTLDDTTEGGLVWYLGVEGALPIGTRNNYGVRVFNGGTLDSSDSAAPDIQGLTIVTNNAIYVEGNYNASDWKPAAFLADSLNILSEAWTDSWNSPSTSLNTRAAATTTINAAFLSGTDVTGDVEGTGGQDAGDYNGGLENYPRFHENWSGRTLNYLGSFVSLDAPRHVAGAWSTSGVYKPPGRNWGYDTRFNDAAQLPPLSPRFVYLSQELFVREYEL
ncbi:MAG: hypothetical protein GY716_08375 [bacterium]|nr:hypothetical protein [bacterium]